MDEAGKLTRILCTRLLAFVVAGVFMLFLHAVVLAESGQTQSSPGPRVKPKSGLRMLVDSRWVNGNGYRPVTVEISTMNQAPMVADRSFHVELTNQNWSGRRLSVASFLDIPAGSASGTAKLLVPQEYTLEQLSCQIHENGRHLKDLDLSMSRVAANYNLALPVILFVDRDAPTGRQRRSRQRAGNNWSETSSEPRQLPNVINVGHALPLDGTLEAMHGMRSKAIVSDGEVLDYLDRSELLALRPPRDLPEQWLEYTCFDFAFISWEDLQFLQTQHADRWRALRRWVAAGSTLCVYGMGGGFKNVPDLERSLDFAAKSADSGVAAAHPGWSNPRTSDFGLATDLAEFYDVNTRTFVEAVDKDGNPSLVRRQRISAPSTPPFILRQLDMGAVVAFSSSDPFDAPVEHWGWLLNSLQRERWNWSHRHGMLLGAGTQAYWSFLIPDVGLPPVNMFRVLITVFVLVIGPLNYYLLRRWRRLHLLLITVPAGAALVTLSLIGYALAADGFHTRVRLRSFTKIDQHAGQAVSWSRQSYYSGLAPSDGMSFGTDTAVYAMQPAVEVEGSSGDYRAVEWAPKQQNLVRGFISSRWTKQFLVVRARDCKAQLAIQSTDAGGLEVENLLRADVQYLILVDTDRQVYTAKDIKAGDKFNPQPEPGTDACAVLRRISLDNRPSRPERLPSGSQYAYRSYRRSTYFYRGNNAPDPSFSEGLLEANMRRISMQGSTGLAPRTYIAVVRQSPEVPIGIRGARQQDSFHIIEGSW